MSDNLKKDNLISSRAYSGGGAALGCNHVAREGSCSTCRLADLCIPIALEMEDVRKLETIVNRGQPLDKSAHVYREGERFDSIYAVRVGSIKTYKLTPEGEEQVTGFYLPGEIFGVDGLDDGTHGNSAKALQTSSICAIPFERLGDLSSRIPSLRRHMFKLIGREITEDQKLITLLSKNSADERMASLLLSLSERYGIRGLSRTHIRLPMARTDIANYLGLTVETVSRVLGRLQKQAIILTENKEMELLDLEKLREIASQNDLSK